MVLLLAVHTVQTVTAKVPLSMIVLQDYVKRKALPQAIGFRMMFPTSGNVSVSIWEAPDSGLLSAWLEENLSQDCQSQVHEVQEDFAVGIAAELARARAAEKVAAGGKAALTTIGQTASKAYDAAAVQMDAFDARTNILTATKETTSAAYGRVKTATQSTLESEAVSTALNKATAAFSWLGRQAAATATTVTTAVRGNSGTGGVASDGGPTSTSYASQPHQSWGGGGSDATGFGASAAPPSYGSSAYAAPTNYGSAGSAFGSAGGAAAGVPVSNVGTAAGLVSGYRGDGGLLPQSQQVQPPPPSYTLQDDVPVYGADGRLQH